MQPLVTTRMPPITFDIDPDLTALLVIDMQNGFAAPRGTIGAAGMDISMTREIIPNIQRLLDAARATLQGLIRPEDDVFEKHRASCFYSSNFEARLRIHGIRMLIVTGTTASFCVDSTIREAYARDFDVIVPGDAISDTEIEATQAVLRSTERFHGFVTTTDDLVSALRPKVLTPAER